MMKVIHVGTPTEDFKRNWTSQGQASAIQEALTNEQTPPTFPDLSNVEVREVDLAALQTVIPSIDGPGVMFQFDELTNDFDFENLAKIVSKIAQANLTKGTK